MQSSQPEVQSLQQHDNSLSLFMGSLSSHLSHLLCSGDLPSRMCSQRQGKDITQEFWELLEDKSLDNTDLSHLYKKDMSEYEQGLSSLAV